MRLLCAAKAKKKKKQSMTGGQLVSMLFYFPVGVICGLAIVRCLDALSNGGASDTVIIAAAAAFFAFFLLSMYLHIIIHEGGHLVFGLLTGYRFSSFRIGKLMLTSDNGKLRLSKYKVAGTGGQCLMLPPKKDKDIPYVLYNLGGALFNLIFSAIAGAAAYLLRDHPFGATLLIIFAAVGAVLGLVNAIPLRIGAVDNDGRNLVNISRSEEARESFRIQLTVNELNVRGMRLRDMPDELFVVPTEEGLRNSIAADTGVYTEQRLMDMGRFAEAQELIEWMLGQKNDLVGLYLSLLRCDRLCCELFGQRRPEVVKPLCEEIDDDPLMASMGNYIAAVRTKCIRALLSGETQPDDPATAKLFRKFDKVCASHPYPSEAESERELVALAQRLAADGTSDAADTQE